MIKGVNKKIIEINDTNNIYFEKAVLYVRSQMSSTPQKHLMNEAKYYLDQMSPENYEKRSSKTLLYFMAAAVITFLIVTIIIFKCL
ncbi:MAG: hypothetical protein Q4F95_04480 [Oscillospiraceae bacterium]|nr:hypothetical protein [Oscillospiraceae bacterium]